MSVSMSTFDVSQRSVKKSCHEYNRWKTKTKVNRNLIYTASKNATKTQIRRVDNALTAAEMAPYKGDKKPIKLSLEVAAGRTEASRRLEKSPHVSSRLEIILSLQSTWNQPIIFRIVVQSSFIYFQHYA